MKNHDNHTRLWKLFKKSLQTYNTIKTYAELDLMTTETIWIVSDGGLANHNSYYGWVIASNTLIPANQYANAQKTVIER